MLHTGPLFEQFPPQRIRYSPMAFRKRTSLPLNGCLHALQSTIPRIRANVINAYNFARRLRTLRSLTPYEYICKD